jgi:hypothetical protein
VSRYKGVFRQDSYQTVKFMFEVVEQLNRCRFGQLSLYRSAVDFFLQVIDAHAQYTQFHAQAYVGYFCQPSFKLFEAFCVWRCELPFAFPAGTLPCGIVCVELGSSHDSES